MALTEILGKLKDKHINGTSVPTPAAVDRYLQVDHELRTPEQIWMNLPGEIIMEFVSNSGNFKEKKVKKFLRCVDDLLVEYKPMDILKMDTDCVKRDGSINETRLDQILNFEINYD